MKNPKRAIRRHHRMRLIARTLKYFVVQWVPEGERLQLALRVFNNRHRCSCYMCNKCRKRYGPTIQELRFTCGLKIDRRHEEDTK